MGTDLGIPIVEVTLSGMKGRIAAAVSEWVVAQERDINEAVNRAVEGFDLATAIHDEVQRQVKMQTHSLISDAMHRVMWDAPDVRGKLTEAIAEAITKRIKDET